MNKVIAPKFLNQQKEITGIIENFDTTGTLFVNGRRNKIKTFNLNGLVLNVKSFKVPNTINKVVYRFFRKSKARRSYEYANLLLEKGIGTPQPIAYFENSNSFSFLDSYYISEQLVADLTFRELVEVPDYPDHDTILRQFTAFSFLLHEKGIEFTDHSPGNTLIKKIGDGKYAFYLVDLNRMNFHDHMSFELRMENLKRLTPKPEMVAVMSNEYAKLYNKPEAEINALLWEKTAEFQRKFWRKKALKKQFKFWKK
ncbi:hypothetical protein [Flavobacterium subsaxonicum]|uniref:Kdo domain containing protein n=1 Tax=Flavobacterium subsaxonicum WB 4.1-42 = DSM 21790 TaxID=1121898 RepID=A0A0A2MK23_9FLAO|nr:hypothetical protein [Flavobacterium subsaxonicum]KGO92992.1 Kdo domain containing protein [Flavobacterium subsaxonicum WB 4.1-42 = DSM 21790]